MHVVHLLLGKSNVLHTDFIAELWCVLVHMDFIIELWCVLIHTDFIV